MPVFQRGDVRNRFSSSLNRVCVRQTDGVSDAAVERTSRAGFIFTTLRFAVGKPGSDGWHSISTRCHTET
ncbi:hypothetical protein ZHAS_00000753 [Anopheles sinensis]|uniref:Uncharacterized protein n=1 Tax=Anopheles sinensis TaxID=74873 RepID=A0A084VAH8_ANOSI|nr:hypothetical protein ZHAS_00000753 [Anopheles sinensis]